MLNLIDCIVGINNQYFHFNDDATRKIEEWNFIPEFFKSIIILLLSPGIRRFSHLFLSAHLHSQIREHLLWRLFLW